MKKMAVVIIVTFLFNIITVKAADVFVIVLQKQEKKKQSRWTLADWMVTKNKIAMMDLWLAMHSSANLFEFYIGGHHSNYDYENKFAITKDTKQVDGGEFGMYITIVGVELEFDKSSEKYDLYSGMLGLRIFGTAYQGTNITLGFGHRIFDLGGDRNYKNNFFQGKFAFNLLHFLGIQGTYQKYFGGESDGINLSGYKNTYGAYLDINFLRIYGNYFVEKLNFRGSQLYSVQNRDGLTFGAKLFF